MVVGCVGPDPLPPDQPDAGSSSSGAWPSATTGLTTAAVDSESSGDESTGEPIGFIEMPDGIPPTFECSLALEDCPPGLKCMPWANDGGSAWNATRCSPVAEDAAEPGEPCVVEGNGVRGIDNCELHAMCWHVDAETNEGTCVAMCITTGSGGAYCEDPTAYCSQSSVLSLCLPTCSPLVQDCPSGQGCYPVADNFVCVADASDGGGEIGSECEFLNACAPGNACLNPDVVPGCEMYAGCCSPYCRLDDPTPPCLDGQMCLPWFEDPPANEALTSLGICAMPWD